MCEGKNISFRNGGLGRQEKTLVWPRNRKIPPDEKRRLNMHSGPVGSVIGSICPSGAPADGVDPPEFSPKLLGLRVPVEPRHKEADLLGRQGLIGCGTWRLCRSDVLFKK